MLNNISKELQIKTIMIYYYTIRMEGRKYKNWQNQGQQDMEQLEILHIAGENTKLGDALHN